MSASDLQPHPTELEIVRGKHLRIMWADAQVSEIPLTTLREACPCAECRTAREERKNNPLMVVRAVQSPQDLSAVASAELVGNYALVINWKDGHNTGIYEFRLLRQLGDEIAGIGPAKSSEGV